MLAELHRLRVSLQKKEMMLAKLRKELSISDQRHAELRKMIEEGKELGGRQASFVIQEHTCTFV